MIYIFDKLTELKDSDMAYHLKARRYADYLSKVPQCQDIEVLDCDVCVIDFFPEFYERLQDIYPMDFDNFPEKEKSQFYSTFQALIPEIARVRIHATFLGSRLTYCFNCEATMCGNEMIYPDDGDWDKLHEETARGIIRDHSEWKVKKFMLVGSTRNRICIDTVSENPEFEFKQFDQGDCHISIHNSSRKDIIHFPYYREIFKNI